MNVSCISAKLNGIGLIKATLTKRYPVGEENYCRNQESTLLVSVESGKIKYYCESAGLWNGTYYVSGQSFTIPSDTSYYLIPVDNTKVVLGVVSAPVWERAQHVIESGM